MEIIEDLEKILSERKVNEVMEVILSHGVENIGKTTRFYYRWRYFLLGKIVQKQGGSCRECDETNPLKLTFSHDGDNRGHGRGGSTVLYEVKEETNDGKDLDGEDVPSVLCQSCHPKIDGVNENLK